MFKLECIEIEKELKEIDENRLNVRNIEKNSERSNWIWKENDLSMLIKICENWERSKKILKALAKFRRKTRYLSKLMKIRGNWERSNRL